MYVKGGPMGSGVSGPKISQSSWLMWCATTPLSRSSPPMWNDVVKMKGALTFCKVMIQSIWCEWVGDGQNLLQLMGDMIGRENGLLVICSWLWIQDQGIKAMGKWAFFSRWERTPVLTLDLPGVGVHHLGKWWDAPIPRTVCRRPRFITYDFIVLHVVVFFFNLCESW